MELKKKQILDAAAELFLGRGFTRTSTLDIAELCNVSKATIYKCFSSKEELGLDVVKYLTDNLLFQVEEYRKREDLTSVEKLRECIVLRMQRFGERNRFMDALVFSFSPQQREGPFQVINLARYRVFHVFAQLLADAYDLKSEMSAWELTMNLSGLIREISVLEWGIHEWIEERQAADFILDCLRGIVETRRGKKPLLTAERMEKIKQYVMGEEKGQNPELQRNQILNALKKQADALSADDRQQAVTAISLLEAECERDEPGQVLVEALTGYLSRWPELVKSAVTLKIITRNGG